MAEMTATEVRESAAVEVAGVSRAVEAAGAGEVPAVTWPTCIGDASETDAQQARQKNGCCAAFMHRGLRSGRRLDP